MSRQAAEGGRAAMKAPEAIMIAAQDGDEAATTAWLDSGGHVDATYDLPGGSVRGGTLLMQASAAAHPPRGGRPSSSPVTRREGEPLCATDCPTRGAARQRAFAAAPAGPSGCMQTFIPDS